MRVNLGIIGGGGSNHGSPCGACKFMKKKCVPGCIFAPYFDSELGASYFAIVHKVFGASNVSKLLLPIPVERRLDAVSSIFYEAQARLSDPVNGCVAHIYALQQQVLDLQVELAYLQGHLATLESPQSPPIPPPQVAAPPVFSIADLPPVMASASAISSMPTTYNVPSLFEQSMAQFPWDMQQMAMMDPSQYLVMAQLNPNDVVDMHMEAHEFMYRHVTATSTTPAPCVNASSSSQPLPSK